jgi:hypothetical protein
MYANAHDFQQCCVTALAALLVMDELHEDDKLFMGSNQERRFALALQKALDSKEGQAIMSELGRSAIAPHSTRKGSAAFASNGTGSCAAVGLGLGAAVFIVRRSGVYC